MQVKAGPTEGEASVGDRCPGVGAVGDSGYYSGRLHRLFRASGGMADALASGASVLRDVGVQVPLRPQNWVELNPDLT
jgi:hypothetical protein